MTRKQFGRRCAIFRVTVEIRGLKIQLDAAQLLLYRARLVATADFRLLMRPRSPALLQQGRLQNYK
jgi:hypothetical protein